MSPIRAAWNKNCCKSPAFGPSSSRDWSISFFRLHPQTPNQLFSSFYTHTSTGKAEVCSQPNSSTQSATLSPTPGSPVSSRWASK